MKIEKPFEPYTLEDAADETIARATLQHRDQPEALVMFGEATDTHTLTVDELRALAEFLNALADRLAGDWMPHRMAVAAANVRDMATHDPDAN